MSSTHLLNPSSDMLRSIGIRFRHAAISKIKDLSGSRMAMVHYLAKTHDLTTSEAAEALDDCIALHARPLVKAA